jgi:hypothetical protein
MSTSKPRIIKDYDKLDPEIQEKIKLEYPFGYSENLITFTNKDGLIISALPFETEDKYYMVRMTAREAVRIVEDDDDFDDDGILKEGIKEEYESKYAEVEGVDEVPDDLDDDFDDDYDDDVDDDADDDDPDDDIDEDDDDYA